MPESIHIRYVRSGGFGGLRAVADVDTTALAQTQSDTAQQIAQLTQAVLTEKAPAAPKHPRNDGHQYQLTIEHGGKRAALEAWEPISSPALRQLIALLDDLSTLSR
jgi:hypothetical protein